MYIEVYRAINGHVNLSAKRNRLNFRCPIADKATQQWLPASAEVPSLDLNVSVLVALI